MAPENPAPPTRRPDWMGWLLLLGAFALLLGLLFPFPFHAGTVQAERAEAKNAVGLLTSALRRYYEEYGKWPDFAADGTFVDPARLAQLMRVLRAQDHVNNPRKVSFFEYKTAQSRGFTERRFVSGFEPTTGVLLDPWGSPYRIVLDVDGDDTVPNPMRSEDPAIHTPVIVWSLGKDGQQADSYRSGSNYTDDVFSWF